MAKNEMNCNIYVITEKDLKHMFREISDLMLQGEYYFSAGYSYNFKELMKICEAKQINVKMIIKSTDSK